MTGMMNMAAKGRKGDTEVAHMTKGEMVVPKEIAAMRPELVAHIQQAIAQHGGDPRKYTVGAGRINPKTGAEEFATEDEIKEAYRTQLGREADAAGLAYWSNNAEGFTNGAFAQGVAAEKAAAPTPVGMAGPVDPNVNDWYRNSANRDADEVGAQYWTNQIKTVGADKAYGEFSKGLKTNEGAYAKNLTLADANKDWTGTQSTAGTSTVDEWARNVFGRDATAEEIAKYGGKTTVADAQTSYADFVSAGTAAGGTAKQMDMLAASRLTAPRTVQPVVAQGTSDYGSLQQEYKPDLQRTVNAPTETIEGRINNLMATDAAGNYTNPVVRQAVDRVNQQFNARGLRNSSMAAQAAQEAAISKAIEIAGPDAERYFQQGRANQDARNVFARDETQQGYTERNKVAEWNQDWKMQERRIASTEWLQKDDQERRIASTEWLQKDDQAFRSEALNREQSFTLRRNYVEAVDRVNGRYSTNVDNINQSNMTQEEKTAAIQNAASVRDGDLTYYNNLFAREWLALAVPVGDMDVSKINNVDTLSNLANDPAQPESVRAAARTRLAQLRAAPAPTPTPTPAPTRANEQTGAGGDGTGGDGSGGGVGGDD